jgi:hypothetical protein
MSEQVLTRDVSNHFDTIDQTLTAILAVLRKPRSMTGHQITVEIAAIPRDLGLTSAANSRNIAPSGVWFPQIVAVLMFKISFRWLYVEIQPTTWHRMGG